MISRHSMRVVPSQLAKTNQSISDRQVSCKTLPGSPALLRKPAGTGRNGNSRAIFFLRLEAFRA